MVIIKIRMPNQDKKGNPEKKQTQIDEQYIG